MGSALNAAITEINVVWMLVIGNTFLQVESALPRYPIPVVVNKILNVSTSCDAKSFNATVEMQYPFKGLLFAKDFSQECKSIGTLQNNVVITLPTSGCGVRLSSRREPSGKNVMYYSITLVAQQDRYLRQISDTERNLECIVQDSAFAIKSQTMNDALETEVNKSNRTGRMKVGDWSNDYNVGNKTEDDFFVKEMGEELTNTLEEARAWMEIIPEGTNLHSGILEVGEPALLTVKSTLPVGIGWRIVDCAAHDGLGDSSQKLLDGNGCPMDESLLPKPEAGAIQRIHLMRHQEAVSRFAAFKFPDRDRLHFSCGMVLCRGSCVKVDCENNNYTGEDRLARTLEKGQPGEVLHRLQIFNSVEVIAPGIDLDESRNSDKTNGADMVLPFGNLPGDRTFCVSPDKMALTFCILGVIFLVAVIVAALALLRARKNGTSMVPYYTRSLFSSSSGLSAYGGSKLLLQESPCMGQSSSSQSLPYGRIF